MLTMTSSTQLTGTLLTVTRVNDTPPNVTRGEADCSSMNLCCSVFTHSVLSFCVCSVHSMSSLQRHGDLYMPVLPHAQQ